MIKLLSFGEILFDVYPDSSHLGGAPLNLAAHLNLLGNEAFILSAVGNDEFGNDAIIKIKSLGINPSFISKLTDFQTGKCLVTLDENKVPSYNLLSDVAYDKIPCPDFDADESFDVFSFGTLALRSEYNQKTVEEIISKNISEEIYCDLNIRSPHYSKRSINFCLENATIAKISDEELAIVCENALGREMGVADAPKLLKEKFPKLKLIIITCGEKGSVVFDCQTNTTHQKEAPKVNVVSTVGAGDSFGAAFLSEYMNGSSIDKALDLASEISAYVCSKEGAIPDDMKEYVSKNERN